MLESQCSMLPYPRGEEDAASRRADYYASAIRHFLNLVMNCTSETPIRRPGGRYGIS